MQTRGAPAAIGIDLLDVQRLERAIARRPRLCERVFTEGERSYAAMRQRPAQHLAARFCAKEAVAKALGLGGWSFGDIEVVATATAPTVCLHGAAAERARARGLSATISLTHTSTTAAAVALLS